MKDQIVNEQHVQTDAEVAARGQIVIVENLKSKLKTANEMLADIFKNNEHWQMMEKDRDTLIKARKTLKLNILKDPKVFNVAETAAKIRKELKGETGQLSLFLELYVKQENKDEIVDSEGRKRQIIKNNKIK